ncbi:hypothetical protein [Frigidibacter sp. MR17.24]|uniref:hypothetical protein n=1 Tax=Frigidibacter sp. MR17.24 TaxID=3127345 RepID=UPI0030131803
MPDLTLHKIFYDERSQTTIEPPYVPLDNGDGPPGWFELWPILHYLETHSLEEDHWYGFVSPKFPEKLGVRLESIEALIADHPTAEVALCSYNWVSLAKWRNVWLSGDRYHPGLIDCAEAFLASIGKPTDLAAMIGDFTTSVHSNYIIAKPRFWRAWQALARQYVDYVDLADPPRRDDSPTHHDGPADYRLKTFVQERLVCWLLQTGGFRTVHLDYARAMPIPAPDRSEADRAARLFVRADLFKRLARRGAAGIFLRLHARAARKAGKHLRRSRREASTPQGAVD